MEKNKLAYYLCGKAFTMTHLGVHLNNVSIKENAEGEFYGNIETLDFYRYDNPTKRTISKMARREIIATFAGYPATRIFDFDAENEFELEDYNHAWNLAAEYVYIKNMNVVGDTIFLNYLEKRKKDAERIVANNWVFISNLTILIFGRGWLSGEFIMGYKSLCQKTTYKRINFNDNKGIKQ